tara:strand:+ start:252 stop:527 length:276 start_codon:yes stop_codon:yes gene_type:complete
MPNLPKTPKQMSMRHERGIMSLRKEHQRIQDDFRQAAGLLRHDLVWSADFEAIRSDLADYLDMKSVLGVGNSLSLVKVVQHLIASENDMSI